MIKKLIISDTQNSATQIFENVKATTLAELRAELPQINFSGKSITERDSRSTLELDDAKLPNQDQVVLFLSTKNVKAGGSNVDSMSRPELYELAKQYKEANPDALAGYSSKSTTELRSVLKNIVEKGGSSVNNEVSRDTIKDRLNQIIAHATFVRDNMPKGEIDTFMESIAQEGAAIKAAVSKLPAVARG